MGPKRNNPGGESLETVVARIDERTERMDREWTKERQQTIKRLDSHAAKIRKIELKDAKHQGEETGRNFSIKRIATLLVIATAVITLIGAIIAITPQ